MPTMKRPSYRRHVYEHLRDEIRSRRIAVGERLPPIKQIAAQLGTSITPVQEAFAVLENEGYVQRQVGRGTEVIDARPEADLRDSVAVCLESSAHVYGDLGLQLAGAMHLEGIAPVTVDISDNDRARRVMLKLARAHVRKFVLHASGYFDLSLFDEPAFEQAVCIGAIHWAGKRLPRMAAVLSDPVAGAALVKKHLLQNNHQNVLVLSSEAHHLKNRYPLADDANLRYSSMRHGIEFVNQWDATGNRWSAAISHPAGLHDCAFDPDDLLSHFEQSEAPTAIFGLRDLEVVRAQQVLRQHRPELLDRLDFIGYYHTPWSQACHPAITTVDIRVDQICNELERVLATLRAGNQVSAEPMLVKPELVEANQRGVRRET